MRGRDKLSDCIFKTAQGPGQRSPGWHRLLISTSKLLFLEVYLLVLRRSSSSSECFYQRDTDLSFHLVPSCPSNLK